MTFEPNMTMDQWRRLDPARRPTYPTVTNPAARFPSGEAVIPQTKPLRKVRRDWKGGTYPAPVFVARFACGRHMAMSWWTKKGKPVDLEAAREAFKAIYRSKYGRVGRNLETGEWRTREPEIVFEYVRPPIFHKPGAMARERHVPLRHLARWAKACGANHVLDYTGRQPGTGASPLETPPEKPARAPSGRKVAAVPAELLGYLDGENDNAAVIAQARQLASAWAA